MLKSKFAITAEFMQVLLLFMVYTSDVRKSLSSNRLSLAEPLKSETGIRRRRMLVNCDYRDVAINNTDRDRVDYCNADRRTEVEIPIMSLIL